MTLFLITAPLLVGFLSFFVLAPRFGGGKIPGAGFAQVVRNPAIVAALSFVPLFIVYLFAQRDTGFGYSPAGLYSYAVVRDYLGWMAVQSVVSYLLVRRIREHPVSDQFLLHLVVATVMLTLLSWGDAVVHTGSWTAHELFFRPLIRAAFLLLFPVALTVADTSHGGGWAVLVMILQPLVAALVPMWFEWIRPGAAVGALMVFLIGTGAALWFLLFHRA